jgi:phosphotransferase system enzyme I (PtsI)
MTAGQIPTIKQTIRRLSRNQARAALEQAMQLTTAEEIERFLDEMAERLALVELPPVEAAPSGQQKSAS